MTWRKPIGIEICAVVVAAAGWLVSGCESRSTTLEPASTAVDESAPSASTSTGAAGITLVTADVAGYEDVIAKHKGKVVLVDFWATWCGPCKLRFPHTVKLSQEFEGQGLAVVSMSLDSEDSRGHVMDFLRQQNATFVNLISKYGAGIESFNEFQIAGGAIPFYKLYDRNGTLRYQFCSLPEGLENAESVDNLDARVTELLNETHG